MRRAFATIRLAIVNGDIDVPDVREAIADVEDLMHDAELTENGRQNTEMEEEHRDEVLRALRAGEVVMDAESTLVLGEPVRLVLLRSAADLAPQPPAAPPDDDCTEIEYRAWVLQHLRAGRPVANVRATLELGEPVGLRLVRGPGALAPQEPHDLDRALAMPAEMPQ